MIRSSLCETPVGLCSVTLRIAEACLLLLSFPFLFGCPVHYPSERLFIVPGGLVVTRSRVYGFTHVMLSGGVWFYGGYWVQVNLNRRLV